MISNTAYNIVDIITFDLDMLKLLNQILDLFDT